MQYEELREQLPQDVEIRDVLWSHLAYISTAENGILTVDDTARIPMEPELEEELFKTLAVPSKYAERCPAMLKEVNVNYWLHRQEDDVRMVMVDGKLHGLLPTRAVYVPTVDVYDQIYDTLFKLKHEIDIHRYHREGSIHVAEMVLPTTEKRYGDGGTGNVYFGGLSSIYSDVLAVHPSITSYYWRQICSNGMRAPEGRHRFQFVGQDRDAILNSVEEAVIRSVAYLETLSEKVDGLRNRKIDDMNEALNRVFKDFKIPNRLRENVREAFEVEPGDSYETLVNAITRAANYVENANDRLNLQTAAGMVTQDNRHRCERCFNVLTN